MVGLELALRLAGRLNCNNRLNLLGLSAVVGGGLREGLEIASVTAFKFAPVCLLTQLLSLW